MSSAEAQYYNTLNGFPSDFIESDNDQVDTLGGKSGQLRQEKRQPANNEADLSESLRKQDQLNQANFAQRKAQSRSIAKVTSAANSNLPGGIPTGNPVAQGAEALAEGDLVKAGAIATENLLLLASGFAMTWIIVIPILDIVWLINLFKKQTNYVNSFRVLGVSAIFWSLVMVALVIIALINTMATGSLMERYQLLRDIVTSIGLGPILTLNK
ncbi:MAG: hypothetical protein WCG01_02550 [bacterium]